MISRAEALMKVPDRETLYAAMIKDGYYCPSLKCSIMTMKFMRAVSFQREFWLPKTEKIRIFISPNPPSNAELAEEVFKALMRLINETQWDDKLERLRCRRTAELILKHPPDKQWSMNMLGTALISFKLVHPIFMKNYQKPKRVVEDPELDDEMIPNIGGFFSDLPIVQQKGKHKRCAILGESKHQRDLKALKKMKLRQEKMNRRIQTLQDDIDEMEIQNMEQQNDAGSKRSKADEVPNVIGNLHEIEEDKDDGGPRKNARKHGQKTPKGHRKSASRSPDHAMTKMHLRQRNKDGNETGTTSQLIKQTAKLNIGGKVSKFHTGDDDDSDSMQVDKTGKD